MMVDRDDSWYRLAACTGLPTALFFPDPTHPDPASVAEAKAVCGRCPVVEQCRDAGASEAHGIWGGLTASERHAVDRPAPQEAA